ncbi:unnamed protein product, partial [Durusdinium trenchii]
AGIAEVLQAVAETGKVPTAASKSTVKRRRDAAVDLETPYGKYVLHTEHNSDNFTLSTDQSVWAIVDHLQHQAALPGLSKKKFADEEAWPQAKRLQKSIKKALELLHAEISKQKLNREKRALQ